MPLTSTNVKNDSETDEDEAEDLPDEDDTVEQPPPRVKDPNGAH